MAERDNSLVLGGASLAVALAAWLWPSEAVAHGGGRVSVEDFAAAQLVAIRWSGPGSPFPKVPRSLVLAIMKEESRFHPRSEDHSERAQERGGAYGLMGMTAATALDLVSKLREWDKKRGGPVGPNTKVLIDKFQSLGTSVLLDPDVNALFGVFYLNQLGQEFGYDGPNVVAAYHEGASRVRKNEAGPHTRQYVADVTAYRKEMEGRA